MNKLAILAGLAFSVAVLSPAYAGYVYKIETKQGEKAVVTTLSVQGGDVKINIEGKGRMDRGMMFFSRDRQEMTVLDPDRSTYMVIDEAMIEKMAMGMKMAGQAAKMAVPGLGGLKNMPGAADKMKKAAGEGMGDKGMVQIRKTSQTGTMNGFAYVVYEVMSKDKKLRDLYVTDWKNVKGGQEVAEALKAMGAFINKMTSTLSQGAGMPGGPMNKLEEGVLSDMDRIDGFIIASKAPRSESTLISATEETMEAFSIPSEYKKMDMDMMDKMEGMKGKMEGMKDKKDKGKN